MRFLLILIATSLALFPCAPATAQTFRLDIAPARTQLVSSWQLKVHCSSSKVEACTEILGATLDCRCSRGSAGWKLSATAQMVPYLYLGEPKWDRHEHAHLDDLRQQVGDYFRQLEGQTFASEEECRTFGDFESAVFSLRMDTFGRISNMRLH